MSYIPWLPTYVRESHQTAFTHISLLYLNHEKQQPEM
jgi:hypothetical protein